MPTPEPQEQPREQPREQPPGPEPARTEPTGRTVPTAHLEPGPKPESFLEKAAYITAPATVVLGLLYYFGCTYTDAYYDYFGIPASDLQFPVQTYVVKSANAVFFPLWFLLVCGLAVLLVLGWTGRRLAVPGREAARRRVTGWLLALGLLLVLVGFPVFFWEDRLPKLPQGWLRDFAPCLIVALGATLAFFAVHMHLNRGRAGPGPQDRTGDRLWLTAGALLIGLLTMSLFFAMARYAATAGKAEGIRFAERGYTKGSSPRAVVYSSVPITHHAARIRFKDLGRARAPYRYQYRGFRILAKSPSRFYLVSYVKTSKPQLVVVPDDGTVRVELSP
ncbi:hypothetical protein ABZ924_27400 [Streptomyces sp. NPDC046876]|uniref:hypothetical protein n=1 Tax=Streptomyces sp. NPDC046876 TaxID=3155616 RepID=UPI00340E379C